MSVFGSKKIDVLHDKEALAAKWRQPEYEKQRRNIKSRGRTTAWAVEQGYEPLTAAEARHEFKQDCGPVIAITCLRASGNPRKHRRARLVDPNKIVKYDRRYTQLEGTGVINHLRRAKKRSKSFQNVLIITEGEIKADYLSDALGADVLSIPGVTTHRKNGDLHPAIASAIKDFDTIEEAFDSDQSTKPHVLASMLELADDLVAAGKRVVIREIVNVPGRKKTGPDDLIQEGHAQAYLDSNLHEMTSIFVKNARKAVTVARGLLPPALRNLKPVSPDWYDKKPTTAEFVIEGLWQTGESCLFVGQAGVGKTYLVLEMHASIATGTQFFTFPVPKPRKSLYLMCERHEQSLQRRWHKIVHAKADAMLPGPRSSFETLLLKNCYLKAISGDSLALIEYVGRQWRPSAVVDALIAELLAANITVLFFDPLSRLHGGDENDASVAAAITKALERIVQRANCAVMIVHHTGKSVNGGMHSGRGSSVFNDNTSETIVLTLVNTEERGKLALPPPEEQTAGDIVKMHHARCSDGRPAQDIYFLRDVNSGLLSEIHTRRKSASAIADDGLTSNLETLRKWAAKLDNNSFTRTAFAKARTEICSNGWSRNESYQVFDHAVATGKFVVSIKKVKGREIPLKRNGAQLYKLNPHRLDSSGDSSSVPGVYRDSRKPIRTPHAHLKLAGAPRCL